MGPGVWGVLATPFTDGGHTLDLGSLAQLARHYESVGATGLTVLGVFGEAARLAVAERADVLRSVVDAVRLPLVMGATSLSTAPLLDEVAQAQQVAGARLAAVMVQVHSPVPAELVRHLTAVHEATGAAIVVQDYPLASGVRIATADLADAVAGLPFVAAVKAESPPTSVSVGVLARRLEVPVFGGLGGIGLLDELAAGGAGAMTDYSFPEGLVACVTAWSAGGPAAARAALLPHLPLIVFEQQPGIGLAIRKACLQARGLVDGAAVRPPARVMPPELRPMMQHHLDALSVHERTTGGT